MVHGSATGLDDITLSGKSDIAELHDGVITNYTLHPNDFGVEPINDFSEISGGDKDRNIELAIKLLKGELSSRHRDLVLVNAAMAMKLAGQSDDLIANYDAAKKQLETGVAYQLLLDYKQPSIMRGR